MTAFFCITGMTLLTDSDYVVGDMLRKIGNRIEACAAETRGAQRKCSKA